MVVGSSLRLMGRWDTQPTEHRVAAGDGALRHSIVLFAEANDDFAFTSGETMGEYIEKRAGAGVTVSE